MRTSHTFLLLHYLQSESRSTSEDIENVYTSPHCIIHLLGTFEPNSIPIEGSGIVDCGTKHLVLCSGVF